MSKTEKISKSILCFFRAISYRCPKLVYKNKKSQHATVA